MGAKIDRRHATRASLSYHLVLFIKVCISIFTLEGSLIKNIRSSLLQCFLSILKLVK
jgi:hypothetical protein